MYGIGGVVVPLSRPLRYSLVIAAFVGFAAVYTPAAAQQQAANAGVQSQAWRPGFLAHVRRMRMFPDQSQQAQPAAAPSSQIIFDNDDSGVISSYRPRGRTVTTNDPFFQSLGTNGRSCATCHQPQEGWSVSAAGIRARLDASGGSDPIFRLVDGATCPSDRIATADQRERAYRLLTTKGLFRIGLPLPAAPALQFKVDWMRDPYRCNSNRVTGITSPTTGIMSVYRRPLPSTNLGFLTAIMWDGREPDLTSQAVDAVLGHAQGDAPPTAAQQRQIVGLESSIFTAQSQDVDAGELDDAGATGGAVALSKQLRKFFVGVNDPTGQNPKGTPFTPKIFNLYDSWRRLPRTDAADQKRASIARGEKIFNTVQFQITDVGGINNPNLPAIVGSCGTCHDTPNVGSHSVGNFLNIGISNAGGFRSPHLDIAGLPIFVLECTSGPLAGQKFETTDPGRALITGQCADIGKFKVPSLRGLAARAPYFHNGSAATLTDVVTFYDRRFSIGLTPREKQDLVNFLSSL